MSDETRRVDVGENAVVRVGNSLVVIEDDECGLNFFDADLPALLAAIREVAPGVDPLEAELAAEQESHASTIRELGRCLTEQEAAREAADGR